MENKKILVFANSIFDNKNYLDKLNKNYFDLSNNRIKKKQNTINIFTKFIKPKHPNSQPKKIGLMKKLEKKIGKEFKMINEKKQNSKFIDLNQKNFNIMQSKLINPSNIKSIITTLKYNNIMDMKIRKKEETNKTNICHKGNKIRNIINNFKDKNRTFYAHFSINKNNSSKCHNKINDCFQVVPILPEKTEGNAKTTSILKNKMRLSSNNCWFRKTTVQKLKIPFLPKVKKVNEKIKDEKEQIKTFLHIYQNPVKRNFQFNFSDKKSRNKQKYFNLTSYEACSLPGTEREQQKINQDAYFVIPNVNNTPNAKIFGIFDGHGINGDKLSQEIRDYFIEFFSNKKQFGNKNILEYNETISRDENLENIYKFMTKDNFKEIKQIFSDINNKIHDKYMKNDFCLKSGTTSNIVMVLNDKTNQSLNKIISINLGDSKSILINEEDKIIELNKKHIPNDPEEKERIEKNGGEISRVDWSDYGPLRIFYKNKHYPGLSMTRVFGDFNADELGVNTIPDIKEYDISEEKPKIIIIATDGLWQFLTNEQVKNIILPYYEEDNISGGLQKLVSSARRMWETMNPKFIDDITIILLFFK